MLAEQPKRPDPLPIIKLPVSTQTCFDMFPIRPSYHLYTSLYLMSFTYIFWSKQFFLQSIGNALKLWLSYEHSQSTEQTHVASQNILTLLYHVGDLLSLKVRFLVTLVFFCHVIVTVTSCI